MRTDMNRWKLGLRAGATLALAGCLWIPAGLAQSNDGDLQASVAAAIRNDAALQGQAVTASTANRVVTLTGTVQNQQQRQEAETVAANVPGVAGIQDNITVAEGGGQAAPAEAQTQTPPPPPADDQQAAQQDAQQAPPPPQQPTAANQLPPPPPPDQPMPARPAYQGSYQGYGSYPPAQPVSGPVTIPGGTLLQIRTSEPLDTRRLQDGATFQATAASDVFEGNVLAIPRGAVLTGVVVKDKKPGALGGSGELELQLTSVSLSGKQYPLATDTWSSRGPNKAGYTVGNTAGGALLGAIIGGAIGRGPGAAVGALAGGGAGLLASAETNGPRAVLMPETLLNFHLASAVTVQPVSWQEAQSLARNAPQLQRRPVYYAPYPPPYYRVYGW